MCPALTSQVVPAKRPCTVTDMLRHTISMNMARKIGSGSPTDDGLGGATGAGGYGLVSLPPQDIPMLISEGTDQFHGLGGHDDSVFHSGPQSGTWDG